MPSNTGGTGTGGVTDSTPSITGPAIKTADGVLTSLASATFTKTSGNLAITTFHASMDEVDAVHLWGDIENRGVATECFPLATLSVDGHAIVTVVDGPIYETGAGLAAVCLPPGGTGVISGIDIQAASNLLDGANVVSYSFRTQPDAKAVPKRPPTLSDLTVAESDFGYSLTGNVVEKYLPVHDVAIRFFIRDSSGLLRDSQYVSVNDGGTVLPTVPIPFEIDYIPDPFSQYVYFIEFEEGVKL